LSIQLKDRIKAEISRRAMHTGRISRHSLRYALFILGAACVALISLGFAWLAEAALLLNARLMHAHWWSAFILLPFGFAGLRWLTIRYALQARGSGIPQVIAAMSLPAGGKAQTVLVSTSQSVWKIALTAGGLLVGASIGREGPSVQVGAAFMLKWGQFWQKSARMRLGFRAESLIAAGAAGGLAAAFNTPLAGVVFAIEELGRGSAVHWDRIVLSGVLTAGFLSLALLGNHSYFQITEPLLILQGTWKAILLCALIAGALGGLFAKMLGLGTAVLFPKHLRRLPTQHPIPTAFACGLIVALLGWAVNGATYGTGYEQTSALLNGQTQVSPWFGIAKWAATIASYFAGIPGGIFTPSLAIGAGIGENIGLMFHGIASPEVLVLISMAAFLAAATQAPITASVIAMEMTRSQDATLHLLAVTLIASFVSRQFSRRPFYHLAARHFRREALTAEAHQMEANNPAAPA